MKRSFKISLAFALSAVLALSHSVEAQEKPASKTPVKKTAAKPAVKSTSLLGAVFGGDDSQNGTTQETTFKEVKAVRVRSSTGNLVAIARGPEDTVIAVAGPARGVGRMANSKAKAGAEVHLYAADGGLVRKWSVEFAATAAATTAAGEVIVAGDGKIAKFDAQGKQLACIDAPHVANLLKNPDAVKKQAEERKKSMVQLYEQQVTMLKKQLEAQAKRAKENDGKTTAAANRSIEGQIKLYEQQVKMISSRPISEYVAELTGQVKTVNAIAAAKDHVFLTCGEAKGYGYTVWRMNMDFTNAKSVLTGLSGCCGQMDVQCCDDCLLVAENSRKRVGVYSLEGKLLRSFGKDSRDGVGEGFGGCCNPMNTFPADNGSVLTAESEGHIKRFDKDGKFVELVAQAKLSGGCKNVAVASSKDGKRVYLMDLPGSRLLIFERKAPANVAAN